MREQVVAKLLAIARAEIGVREEPSNRGPRVEEYQAVTGTAVGSAWCGCFCAWVFTKAGIKLKDIWKLAGARNWFGLDKAIRDLNDVKPGDVFGVYSDSLLRVSHVGIIESVDFKKRTFKTIEGNTNEAGHREGIGVFTRVRYLDKRTYRFARWIED